ncbi:MAG TPA: MATE family efflux transporter [Kineosporiaceae bacterium]|nr:MATE family efflux transporter [Kineosporiaceae bacterium]
MSEEEQVHDGPTVRADSRAILGLAVPALGALVAEPLFLLADSAVVGRLGTVPLAALGIAGGLLAALVSAFVFLAYGTTAAVARRIGAGDRAAALQQGVDGLWLAAGLGVLVAIAGELVAPQLVAAFDPPPGVAAQAVDYLRFSVPGIPAMLVVLAATGVLRGLLDTRTPLAVAAAGAALNVALNVVLVHGVHLGIAGSAVGTASTQVLMAITVTAVVVRGARTAGAPLRPDLPGIRAAARAGGPLLVRTLALRAALLVTTYAATAAGPEQLAAHQVVNSVWGLLALALDAVAIAAQALTGAALGAGDVAAVRAATRTMVRWGLGAGAALAVVVAPAGPLLAPLFTADPQVRTSVAAALVVAAVTQPLAGYVFVLDGVLIGAGDGGYLAWAALAQLAVYAPLALLVAHTGSPGTGRLVLLWAAFSGGYLALRAVALGQRARSDAWLVTGAVR